MNERPLKPPTRAWRGRVFVTGPFPNAVPVTDHAPQSARSKSSKATGADGFTARGVQIERRRVALNDASVTPVRAVTASDRHGGLGHASGTAATRRPSAEKISSPTRSRKALKASRPRSSGQSNVRPATVSVPFAAS